MGKLPKLKRGSDSILYGQRPAKTGKRRTAFKLFIRRTAYLLITVGVVVFGHFAFKESKRLYAQYFPPQQVNWKVSVLAGENETVQADVLDKIERDAIQLLQHTERPDLGRLAEELQRLEGAKRISIVRSGPDALQVLTSFRLPVLKVETPSGLRLLSDEGHIYGKPVSPHEHELPLLSGLFSHDTKPMEWKDDGSLILSDVKQQIIKEVITLTRLAADQKVDFNELRYVQFRGLVLIDRRNDFEVSLGRPPFDKKIARLEKILLELKQKGTTASRIELDFEGKAFIKEKTL